MVEAEQKSAGVAGGVWRGEIKALAACLALGGSLYLFGMFFHDLWRPAEPREAAIAREMLESGNWSATYLNGGLFLEKPPLYTWAIAAALKAFGYHPWAVRIPVFLFTIGTLALVFFLARTALGIRGAQAAAVALATMGLFLEVNRGAMIDNGLVFVTTLAMFAFARVVTAEAGRPTWGWGIAFYIALALAFLIKGGVGPLLVLAGAGCFTVFCGRWRAALRTHPGAGVLIFLLIVGAWLLALWLRGGAEYFYVFFVRNHFNRFMGREGPGGGLFYYVPVLPAAIVPWTILAPCAGWVVWRRFKMADEAERDFWRLLFWWVFGMFALLSAAGSKSHQYIMPLLPALAVGFGAWVDYTVEGGEIPKWARSLTLFFLIVITAAAASLPLVGTAILKVPKAASGAAWAFAMAVCGALMLRAAAWAEWRKCWRWAAALTVGTAVTFGAFLEPGIDAQKSMATLRERLSRRLAVVPGTVLYAHGLNENSTGFLVFNGIKGEAVYSHEQIAAAGAGAQPALLVVDARDMDAPEATQNAGFPAWVPLETVSAGGRIFYLLGNTAYFNAMGAEFKNGINI